MSNSNIVNLKIHGGKKLSGSINTNTSKNGAMGVLAASLLNKGKTTIHDVPRIEEVNRILETLESIGVRCVWLDNKTLQLKNPEKFDLSKINSESAGATRSIIMFVGGLIHNLTKFEIPNPQGCKLGKRSSAGHIYALEDLGVKIKSLSKTFQIEVGKLKAKEIVMFESGDTATENIIIASSLIPGKTTLKFGSHNYMVRDTIAFLQTCGVDIKLNNQGELEINGVKEINKDIDFYLSEDPIESMMFIAAAIVTNSTLRINRCPIDFLELELYRLKKLGLKYTVSKHYLSKNKAIKLADITIKTSKLKSNGEKIESRPYPGINIDNLPFFVPIAAVTEGQTLIHDWVYENRAIYYMEMSKIGVNMLLADPHRVFITGKTKFKPAEVVCPPALRPAMIILLGMLAAEGISVLRNIYSIARGYEDIAERLKSIGADIKVLI